MKLRFKIDIYSVPLNQWCLNYPSEKGYITKCNVYWNNSLKKYEYLFDYSMNNNTIKIIPTIIHSINPDTKKDVPLIPDWLFEDDRLIWVNKLEKED